MTILVPICYSLYATPSRYLSTARSGIDYSTSTIFFEFIEANPSGVAGDAECIRVDHSCHGLLRSHPSQPPPPWKADETHCTSIFQPQAFQPFLSFPQSTGVVDNEILLKLSLVRVSITFAHVVNPHTRSLMTVTAILGPSFLLPSSSVIPTHTPRMFSLATSFPAPTRPKARCSPLVSF